MVVMWWCDDESLGGDEHHDGDDDESCEEDQSVAEDHGGDEDHGGTEDPGGHDCGGQAPFQRTDSGVLPVIEHLNKFVLRARTLNGTKEFRNNSFNMPPVLAFS